MDARTLAADHSAGQWTPARLLVLTNPVAGCKAEEIVRTLLAHAGGSGVRITSVPCGSADAAVETFAAAEPELLLISQCSGPGALAAVELARSAGIPCLFHAAEDVLKELPPVAATPDGAAALRAVIAKSDLLYVQTAALRSALDDLVTLTDTVTASLCCSVNADRLPQPLTSPFPVIGFAGREGEAAGLSNLVPVIERLLDENPVLRFETLGTIAMPEALRRFGCRVASHQAEPDSMTFLRMLQSLGWWVGALPLEDSAVNRSKPERRWVSFAAAGIPLVASRNPAYDRAFSGGAGLAAEAPADWYAKLAMLLADRGERFRIVRAARMRLVQSYTPAQHARELATVFARARANAARS